MAKQTTTTPPGKVAASSRPVRSKPATAGGGGRDGTIGRRFNAGFFEASWAELKKVTWPTREQTQNLTVAVFAMTVAIAVFLGVIDTSLDQLVKVFIPH